MYREFLETATEEKRPEKGNEGNETKRKEK